MTIREIIQNVARESVTSFGVICEVISVSDTTCLCSPIDGSADIEDVRLQTEESDGILLVPAVGSYVVVQMINDVEGVVIMCSELSAIKFLDGTYGGLIRVVDLVTKLNNLENKVNSLITYINTHTHASNGTPPSPIFSGGSLTPTVRGDIENNKITHGTV